MTSQFIPVEPFDCVVFGGTGDLAERKLLPALYHRQLDQQLSEPTRIIGASRAPMTDEEYRDYAKNALKEHLKGEDFKDDEVQRFCARLHYVSVDAKSEQGWDKLKDVLEEGKERVRAFYLAVAPALFGPIAEQLRDHKLITKLSRIVVEKPIGRDLASALELNNTIGKVFREEQIFRIDHYLGKETVQNLMALRFANALYEPLWNSAHIDHVQITVAESVGLEGRAGYYDKAGALRDMVQNHMLQLLCLVAMEAPSSLEAEAVRDEKLKVLRALKPIDNSNVEKLTVRGQYRAGASAGGPVKGYLEELEGGVSNTETFVAMKLFIDNWRWAGVPFYLRTGKRMTRRLTEIVVQFKCAPFMLFSKTKVDRLAPNLLVIRIQPDEGISLRFDAKVPGPTVRIGTVDMDFQYADYFGNAPNTGYETLLHDALAGDATLFQRADSIELGWQVVQMVLDVWKSLPTSAFPNYASGSWGPTEAEALLRRDGREWWNGGRA